MSRTFPVKNGRRAGAPSGPGASELEQLYASQCTELEERVKELNCLLSMAEVFGDRHLGLEELLRRVAGIMVPAWQYPQKTVVEITLNGVRVASEGYTLTINRLEEPVRVDGREVGKLVVGYLDSEHGLAFLDSERKLLAALAEHMGAMYVQKQAEVRLKETAQELRRQKTELEHKNIALKEVLAQIAEEKEQIRLRTAQNIENLVKPILRKLRGEALVSEERKRHLDLIDRYLGELLNADVQRIADPRMRLSPRELEIALMVRDGLRSKEIADRLHLSLLTVERHRHNIRRKLGIDAKQVNLGTYLRRV